MFMQLLLCTTDHLHVYLHAQLCHMHYCYMLSLHNAFGKWFWMEQSNSWLQNHIFSYDTLVWESLKFIPTNMYCTYAWFMVKCSCYLGIVEGILVHGVGRPLSVQFEHNHPTVMPYTMGQRAHKWWEVYVRSHWWKNPWRYIYMWCFN